ncbi:MAG: antibiotic biosynthesis monooxygenase [Thermoplasmata archaeon]
MIGRLWRGWTAPENADTYETLLRTHVLPRIHRVEGYRGAYALRREVGEEVEFATLTLWESMDAVREFAGENYETAVVPKEAQVLLSRYDRTSAHYDVVLEPD